MVNRKKTRKSMAARRGYNVGVVEHGLRLEEVDWIHLGVESVCCQLVHDADNTYWMQVVLLRQCQGEKLIGRLRYRISPQLEEIRHAEEELCTSYG